MKRLKRSFSGTPYFLGPVIGSLGPYAIVDWIDWGERRYVFSGLIEKSIDRVITSDREILVPPGMRYGCDAN